MGEGMWKSKIGQYFDYEKEYKESYNGLLKLRNRLLNCPENWKSTCRERLENLSEFMEEVHPSLLTDKARINCNEYRPNFSEFQTCTVKFISTADTKINTERLKLKQFLSRIYGDFKENE